MKIAIVLLLLRFFIVADVYTTAGISLNKSYTFRELANSTEAAKLPGSFSGYTLWGGVFTENGYEVSLVYTHIKGSDVVTDQGNFDINMDGFGLEFGKVITIGTGQIRFECSAGLNGTLFPFRNSRNKTGEKYLTDGLTYQLALYGNLRMRLRIKGRFQFQIGYKYEWPFKGNMFAHNRTLLLRQQYLYCGVSF